MALKFCLVFVAFLVFVATEPLSVGSTYTKHPPKAFNSLQHLQGCHKGQTVQGLHELKHYLSKFGYFHPEKTKATNTTDDEFDDYLESAIKSYQKFYHLKVTGSLDPDTVKQMRHSRCGVADVTKSTNPTMSHRKMKHHSNKKFHMVSHYNFIPGTPRWAKAQLTYSFSSSVQVVDEQVLKSVCSRAFKRWQDVTHFTFQEAPQGSTGDIQIGFHRGNHGDGAHNAFDGPGDTLAHAFEPTIGWFHYDADENWSTNPTENEVDLESLAVHEIGHLLGLDHSDDANAIMYAYFDFGVVKRDLHQDDINGIRALYSL